MDPLAKRDKEFSHSGTCLLVDEVAVLVESRRRERNQNLRLWQDQAACIGEAVAHMSLGTRRSAPASVEAGDDRSSQLACSPAGAIEATDESGRSVTKP
jgi:hypothetical protein